MKKVPHPIRSRQGGASLIEVLVAVLILSFGLLSLGAMLSLSVQMPKLSGFRTTATNIASDHIERIRANPDGFKNGAYVLSSYTGPSMRFRLQNVPILLAPAHRWLPWTTLPQLMPRASCSPKAV
jgi:Tfp pilus assembly protein PilV